MKHRSPKCFQRLRAATVRLWGPRWLFTTLIIRSAQASGHSRKSLQRTRALLRTHVAASSAEQSLSAPHVHSRYKWGIRISVVICKLVSGYAKRVRCC